MATRDENGWQSEKTLAECIRYMFENEISTDVCIEVGPPNGETVTFRAHKCILVSRSEVFQGMFSSGMIECRNGLEAKVRVEDIDADIFKEVLNYMYCESASVCPDSAVYLMYAAKKYMLSKLVTECRRCLLKNLDTNNVIRFLEYSLQVDEEQLQSNCLKLISVNARAVLTEEKIASASRQVMKAILEAENIQVSESIMYETAVNWAKHQLQSAANQGENPTDLQIREALGDLLYKIRFPVMKPTEFAAISAANNVLTAEEKESIYYFLVTKDKNCQLKFPTEKRIGEEVWIDGTVTCVTTQWRTAPYVDAINFATDHNILLTSIGLFMGYKEREYDVDVEILHATKSMFKKRVTVPYARFSTPFKILLDEPIVISAGFIYSVKALTYESFDHNGYSSRAVSTKETVTFTFSKHSQPPSTSETHSEVSRLYFWFL